MSCFRRLCPTANPSVKAVDNCNDQKKSGDVRVVGKGVYEIHVTVDPQDDYVGLLEAKEADRRLKIVFAVSSAKNNQYMVSLFCCTSAEEAIHSAIHLGKTLEKDYRLKVVRIKVEAHGTHRFPQSDVEFKTHCATIYSTYGAVAGTPYFEFHVKVTHNTKHTPFIRLLEGDVKLATTTIATTIATPDNCLYAAVSHNLCSANPHPLLTVRVYNLGFDRATELLSSLTKQLVNNGYVLERKLQQEFSIYDSYPFLDQNWLL
jgi:hypothetical protein